MKDTNKDPNYCSCTCDTCGHKEVIDGTSYTRINNELRAMGWIVTKIKDKYVDFCSDKCLKDYNKKLLKKENEEDGFSL